MNKDILLITSARESGWLDQKDNSVAQQLLTFADAINTIDGGVNLMVTSLDRIDFFIDNGTISVFDHTTERDLQSFDAIHLRSANRDLIYYADYAKAIALYVTHHGKVVFDSEDVGASFGKLSQGMLFALNGIPTPKTWARWNGGDLEDSILRSKAALPLIVKASMGIKGQNNYLIKTEAQLHEVLASATEPFVAQEVIPNKGDYRVLLMGEATPFVFWRPQVPGSHLSNTSQGSVPEKNVEIDPVAMEYALKVQQLTNRVCVGVDVMQNSETGDWVVLEANISPALAMGAFNDEKAVRYVEMIHGILKKNGNNNA